MWLVMAFTKTRDIKEDQIFGGDCFVFFVGEDLQAAKQADGYTIRGI